ncbi:MAG TPA: PEP-CTERM sorting domain-containing protein, partial [Phycisphaeraceae bacterium]
DEFSGTHGWVSNSWHLAGMDELDIARWLFAQVGYVPEPGTVVLLAAGLGATLLRRRQNRS